MRNAEGFACCVIASSEAAWQSVPLDKERSHVIRDHVGRHGPHASGNYRTCLNPQHGGVRGRHPTAVGRHAHMPPRLRNALESETRRRQGTPPYGRREACQHASGNYGTRLNPQHGGVRGRLPTELLRNTIQFSYLRRTDCPSKSGNDRTDMLFVLRRIFPTLRRTDCTRKGYAASVRRQSRQRLRSHAACGGSQ